MEEITMSEDTAKVKILMFSLPPSSVEKYMKIDDNLREARSGFYVEATELLSKIIEMNMLYTEHGKKLGNIKDKEELEVARKEFIKLSKKALAYDSALIDVLKDYLIKLQDFKDNLIFSIKDDKVVETILRERLYYEHVSCEVHFLNEWENQYSIIEKTLKQLEK